jgi:uncharacterized protein YkwD
MYKWSASGPQWPLVLGTSGLFLLATLLGDPRAPAAGLSGRTILVRPVIASTMVSPDTKERNPHVVRDPAVSTGNSTAAVPLSQAAVALANRDRAAAGLPALVESAALDEIANIRAQQMVVDGLTHVRPGSQVMAVTELLRQRGLTVSWHGENIFWTGGPPFDDAAATAEDWWMASAEHRDNILRRDFRQVGIGAAVDGGKLYIAEVFTD